MVGRSIENPDGKKRHFQEDLSALDSLSYVKGKPERESLKILIIYIIAGASWILLSDKGLSFLVRDKDTFTFISMIKGWMYVAASGLLIYALVHGALKKTKSAEVKLVSSYEKLAAANEELEAAYEQLAASEEELRHQYDKALENQEKLKAYEEKLYHLAYYDQLTGLCNRISFIEKLNELAHRGENSKIALILIDLDNFKYVNDAMGHSFGDQLIIKAGERINSFVKDGCTAYRLAGDEFILLVEDFKDIADIEKMAVSILKAFKGIFEVAGSSLYVTVSMGISVYPEHGTTSDELLKNADIAIYKAKEEGRNRIVFFVEPMKEAVTERVTIEKHLRAALENNEFELFYQPQLDIAANKVSGFEALLRWRNQELGYVPPDKFISIAEDTHLIIPIGEWVLRNSCLFLKELHKQGYGQLSISVNVSMLQLLQDDFIETVMEALDSARLKPKYLELEITESILMESYEMIASKLMLLKGQGIRIALDDFGKGYSSMNHLKQLPISTLKIDKTFIDTISTQEKDKSLTSFIVKIGRSMDLCVVAEGVETQEQMDYLVKNKCNKIQGYLFSKPIPEKEVSKRMCEYM